LSERESDFVGNISVDLGERFTLDYALQLDNDNLSSQRHEIDNSFKIGPLKLGTRYFYANALQGTDLDDSREQIRNSARLNLTDEWSLVGATQYDLAEETEGLRRVSYGLDYQGQCMTFLINGTRRLTRDSSGDSGTTIMMRLGLKNLGEFETSGFSFGSDE
jgi:LPS-assembly protein